MLITPYQLTLLVIEGVHRGQRVPVPQLPFVIGRAPSCQLRPNSPIVGSRHCVLLARNGSLLLTDLGSTNGTYLNGVRLEGTAAVGDGDELAVGPLRFQLRVEKAAPRTETSVEDDAAQALLDGKTAHPLPVSLSTPPLLPLREAPLRRSTPATAARGILEMMRRNDRNGRA